MKRVFVAGTGAVSPAGWSVVEMHGALQAGQPLPIQPLERPGWTKPLRARLVPNPVARPAFMTNPRLRRSSSITHYAAAAALDAGKSIREQRPDSRLGLIVCLQSGCVQYTFRFYKEFLDNPQTASPLLFPETVFAAPASHLSTLLDNAPVASTIIGDPASFAQGLALGASWIVEDLVDACVVVGAEETNWLRADALWHLEHAAIIACGAGAICLCSDQAVSKGVELSAVTEAHPYTAAHSRVDAARAMRAQLEEMGTTKSDLLCDGIGDSARADKPEIEAWRDWPGGRLSPKLVLGEGLMACSAWQCVAACEAVERKDFTAASVSLVGCNQQAVGVRFKQPGTS